MKNLLLKLFLSSGVVLLIQSGDGSAAPKEPSISIIENDRRLILDSIFADPNVIKAFEAVAKTRKINEDDSTTDELAESSKNDSNFKAAYTEALKNALKEGLGENSPEYKGTISLIEKRGLNNEIDASVKDILEKFRSNLGNKVAADDNVVQAAINKTFDSAVVAASNLPMPGAGFLQGLVDFFRSIRAVLNKTFFENSIKEDLVKIYQDKDIAGLSKELAELLGEDKLLDLNKQDLSSPSGRILLKTEIEKFVETYINRSARNANGPIDNFIKKALSNKDFAYEIVLSLIEHGKDSYQNIIQNEIFKSVAKQKLQEYGIKNAESYIKSLEIEKAPKLNSTIRKEAFTEITNNFTKNNLEAELQKQFMENKIDVRGDFDIYFYKDNEGKTYVALEKKGFGSGSLMIFESVGNKLNYIKDDNAFKGIIDKISQSGNVSEFRVGRLINLRDHQNEVGNKGLASELLYYRDLDRVPEEFVARD